MDFAVCNSCKDGGLWGRLQSCRESSALCSGKAIIGLTFCLSLQQDQGLTAHIRVPLGISRGLRRSQYQGRVGWLCHLFVINTRSLYQTALSVLSFCLAVRYKDMVSGFVHWGAWFFIVFVGYFYLIHLVLGDTPATVLPSLLLRCKAPPDCLCFIRIIKGVSSDIWVRSRTLPQQLSCPFSQ